MDIIKLSTDIADMEEYVPLPAGPYRAELRDIEVKHSEKVPLGYFYCSLRIDPSDYPADYDAGNAPDGLNVVYARVSVPDPNNRRTVAPFKAFLKALNVDAKGDSFDPKSWIGKEVQVLLSTSEYNNAPVNNVEAVQPLAKV